MPRSVVEMVIAALAVAGGACSSGDREALAPPAVHDFVARR